jgi:hypothetical protein
MRQYQTYYIAGLEKNAKRESLKLWTISILYNITRRILNIEIQTMT